MKQLKSLFLFFVLTTVFFSAKAGNENGNNGNHYGQNKHSKEGGKVPIDGGISILLAAGIGYGVKRVSDKNKKRNLQQQQII